MSNTAMLALAGLTGCGFGALFFGGLWWTVRKGLSSDRPAWWFLGSLLLRTAVTIAGFVVVSGGQASRLLACLFGFVIVRELAKRIAQPPLSRDQQVVSEAPDAP